MTGNTVESIQKEVEVISINDSSPESDEPVIPHERQVVDDVIALWKEDPDTESMGAGKLHALVKSRHPNWSLSEKRVKTLLKKFGLNNSSDQQFNYSNEITSSPDPTLELPDKVKVLMTNKRGKGLYSKANISKGDLIWEEQPMFFVPPLANLKLIRAGKACTYCARSLTKRSASGTSALRGLDCNACPELWCSINCKKQDHLHSTLKHLTKNATKKKINGEKYLELEEYCIQEQWNALFAITLIYANILEDPSGEKESYFKSMARVSQEVRYKALNPSAGSFDSFGGGALFVQEQQENLWKEGYDRFSQVFPTSSQNGNFDYKEFLMMLGSYNINNLNSCVYKIHSHLNHNCSPSVSVETSLTARTEGIKVFAARDIKANEELTTTYVNPSHTVLQRQRELRANWGFTCSCNKCKDDAKIQHRRQSSSSLNKSNEAEAMNDKSKIRKMLEDTKETIGDGELELEIPSDLQINERRKSVRFDEKVVAHKE